MLPIAEVFVSPQGEGLWAGKLCCFIRTAGCTVGKPYSKQERAELPELQTYQEKCTAWNNSTFACDTNYRMKEKLSIQQILELAELKQVSRVCLTGGEPLMHDVATLLVALWSKGIKVHVETSGTKPFKHLQELAKEKNGFLWVAVSPKKAYTEENLQLADELKILVDESFDTGEFEMAFGKHLEKVWLQPINYEFDINRDNMQLCLRLQRERYPSVSISSQMHKVWCCR